MASRRIRRAGIGLVALTALAMGLAACGSSDSKKDPTKVTVTVADAGKSTKYTIPASIDGGLVQLTVQNQGKAPHGAQLVRIEGNHSTAEALKVVNSNSDKTPAWVRALGGVGDAPPGGSADATMNLPEGNYLVVDTGGPNSSGPPGYAKFTVKSGKDGDLPSTDTTITGANPSKDKYKWEVDGPVKSGDNQLKFVSKGDEAIHLMIAVRIKSGNPTNAQILEGLKSNGPPPFADLSTFTQSAVLDGGDEQVVPMSFAKPGKYVLFCPLADRDGGKPHFEQGMFATLTVS
jgi:hypothetical protein